jgi:hypothetical protein
VMMRTSSARSIVREFGIGTREPLTAMVMGETLHLVAQVSTGV